MAQGTSEARVCAYREQRTSNQNQAWYGTQVDWPQCPACLLRHLLELW